MIQGPHFQRGEPDSCGSFHSCPPSLDLSSPRFRGSGRRTQLQRHPQLELLNLLQQVAEVVVAAEAAVLRQTVQALMKRPYTLKRGSPIQAGQS